MFEGSRVLVTGASGFIGGHLAAELADRHGADVLGLGRTFRTPAPTGVTHEVCDLADVERLESLLAGREVVFHLAAWVPRRGEGLAEAEAINVTAVDQLLRAAGRAGCRRVVLVSSVAAYGLPDHDVIAEDTPLDTTQRTPTDARRRWGRSLPAPPPQRLAWSCPWSGRAWSTDPGSTGWTLGMYRLVKKGTPVLFGSGGHAYPVYVDDVVDMLVRCGWRPEAAGEAYNCVDHSIGWPQFFGYYGQMAGRAPRRIPVAAARLIALASQILPLNIPLDRDRLRQYLRDLQFPTDKAHQQLDWEVQVPLDGRHAPQSRVAAADGTGLTFQRPLASLDT